MSAALGKALRQVQAYGDRLESDAGTRSGIETRCDVAIDALELRLVAGRRLRDAHAYHLLSQAGSDDRLEVSVSAWDGFLAELERVAVR
jgi:hypothetical protein